MNYFIHPDYTVDKSDRDRSMRAAERYEIERALRTADERKRAERRQQRKQRNRRYLRLVLGRVA